MCMYVCVSMRPLRLRPRCGAAAAVTTLSPSLSSCARSARFFWREGCFQLFLSPSLSRGGETIIARTRPRSVRGHTRTAAPDESGPRGRLRRRRRLSRMRRKGAVTMIEHQKGSIRWCACGSSYRPEASSDSERGGGGGTGGGEGGGASAGRTVDRTRSWRPRSIPGRGPAAAAARSTAAASTSAAAASSSAAPAAPAASPSSPRSLPLAAPPLPAAATPSPASPPWPLAEVAAEAREGGASPSAPLLWGGGGGEQRPQERAHAPFMKPAFLVHSPEIAQLRQFGCESPQQPVQLCTHAARTSRWLHSPRFACARAARDGSAGGVCLLSCGESCVVYCVVYARAAGCMRDRGRWESGGAEGRHLLSAVLLVVCAPLSLELRGRASGGRRRRVAGALLSVEGAEGAVQQGDRLGAERLFAQGCGRGLLAAHRRRGRHRGLAARGRACRGLGLEGGRKKWPPQLAMSKAG